MQTDLKKLLKSLPNRPGIYQMIDADSKVLYVGKAKNLKNRVASYFRPTTNSRIHALMMRVVNIETIITASENEALLLEGNLIKKLRPRYNILFKDDKSFPYLLLTEHAYPRLAIHRGPKKTKGTYFGPFPSASSLRSTYNLLQKIFRVRVCGDSYFANRSRPCMLYQIKRCSAPCVNYISSEAYAVNIKFIEEFVAGKNNEIVNKLTELMEDAANSLNYEKAAEYRDEIGSLRQIQKQQVMVMEQKNLDVIGIALDSGSVVVNVLFVRNGLVIGDKTFIPEISGEVISDSEVAEAFLLQHYIDSLSAPLLPEKILVGAKLPDRSLIVNALQAHYSQKIMINDNVIGVERKLVQMAKLNADHALRVKKHGGSGIAEKLLDLKNILRLAEMPKKIECFDVSHTQGESTVVSCVVFNEYGPSKSDYRRFNIIANIAGDDYGALREALMRHFKVCEHKPDVLLIDGGKGQLSVAAQVLNEQQITGIIILAIAKGKSRKPGDEEIFVAGQLLPLDVENSSPAFHLLQQIRDEAHRFAIETHRKKIAKSRTRSVLEKIPGVGPLKRSALLKYFGGLQEIESVGVEDLAKVEGINIKLARRIYDYLHG